MRRLEGIVQTYAWGSTDFIAGLLGSEPTGEPQAELWLGAHPSAPALIDGQPLDAFIAENPNAALGPTVVAEFGPLLPYLLKVLSAARPLSLQAHPSRAQAEHGYAREQQAGVGPDASDRTYRDAWPKPEMLCALVETDILCGFRDPAETYALFERLGVPSALELVAPLRSGDGRALQEVFETILSMGDGDLAVVTEVAEAARAASQDGELGAFARTALDLAEPYPDDPGVLAALLMNRITLQPYEATYLPAGNLHAYLRGSGVEIMANSDNVLRGGLTSKHVDVAELLTVLDFTPGFPGRVEPVEEVPGRWRYPTPAPEFALWRLEPDDSTVELPAADAGRVLLVIDGSVVVPGSPELTLGRGDSAFAGAGEQLAVRGRGTVFVAGPGLMG